MAITKLLRLKEAARGNPAAHLKHNLEYICNSDKCEGGLYIGGNAGTRPEIIYETMMENKRLWGKTDGSQGFHYVISFPPELNVSADTAYQVAEDFVRKLLGDDFYYAFAVHNDQHHMHVHITFDSVSKTDGHKFHSPKGDWKKRIQPITDEICRKYGLPVLEFTEEKKGKDYGQWKHERDHVRDKIREDVSWYDLIRDDIDAAIAKSSSFEELLDELADKRYEIKLGKYLSLRPYGKERAVRSSRLGDAYSIGAIKERIFSKEIGTAENDFVRYGNREEIIAVLRIRKAGNRSFAMTPFQRAYYRRWHNCFLRNKPGRRDPWKTNADVVRVRKLSDAVKYMIDQDIRNFEMLEKRWEQLQERKTKLKEQKEFLKNMERTEDLKLQVKEKLAALRGQEKELAAEEKLLDNLYMFYFDMPVPAHTSGKEKPKERRRWERARTRITVHKKLILRKDPDGSYVVKLPGKEEYIRLPAEDTFLYKSGEILSAFLFDDEDYEVTGRDGELFRKEAGETIKANFDRQKDRSREKGR